MRHQQSGHRRIGSEWHFVTAMLLVAILTSALLA